MLCAPQWDKIIFDGGTFLWSYVSWIFYVNLEGHKNKIANSWKFWSHCANGAFVTQCLPRVQLHFVTREQNGCYYYICSFPWNCSTAFIRQPLQYVVCQCRQLLSTGGTRITRISGLEKIRATRNSHKWDCFKDWSNVKIPYWRINKLKKNCVLMWGKALLNFS